MQCSGIIQLLVLIVHIVKIDTNGNLKECYVKEYTKEESGIPKVPEYLQRPSETKLCRGTEEGTRLLNCNGVFIRPGCVCSYHQVANESFHKYTACPVNSKVDSVLHMTCSKCREYSINHTGPCLNGGSVRCSEEKELSVDLSCLCPQNYSGRFCENKNVTLYRICHIDLQESNLPNCQDKPKEVCKTVFGSNIFKCPLNYSKVKLHPPCNSIYEAERRNSKAPERRQVTTANSSSFFQKTFITLICFTFVQITFSS